MEQGRFNHHPERVLAAVDENTVGVVAAILGTTYTGELEPIAGSAPLDKLAAGGGVDVSTRRRVMKLYGAFCIRTW